MAGACRAGERGVVSSPGTACSSGLRAGGGPGPATRRLPPGGRWSPREHLAATSHSRCDRHLDRPFPLLALCSLPSPSGRLGQAGPGPRTGPSSLTGEKHTGWRVWPGRAARPRCHMRPAGGGQGRDTQLGLRGPRVPKQLPVSPFWSPPPAEPSSPAKSRLGPALPLPGRGGGAQQAGGHPHVTVRARRPRTTHDPGQHRQSRLEHSLPRAPSGLGRRCPPPPPTEAVRGGCWPAGLRLEPGLDRGGGLGS